jgi:hypothetical protein
MLLLLPFWLALPPASGSFLLRFNMVSTEIWIGEVANMEINDILASAFYHAEFIIASFAFAVGDRG